MPTVTGRATDFITFSRTSNATVTGADGKIKWAGHNLVLFSEQFDSTAWGKTNVTVNANAGVAPNGTTTAEQLLETTTNAGHLQGQSVATAAGRHTFAIYAKPSGRDFVGLYNGDFSVGKIFDIANGTVGSDITAAPVSASVTEVGNGWYRCEIVVDTTATTSNWRVYVCNSSSTFSYAGDITKGIYLWGAHLYRSDLGSMVLNPARGDAYYPTTPRNLLGNTEDFNSWATKSGLAATPVIVNTIVAPNGLQTADKIVENSSASTHYVAQTTASLNASPYVASVYAKAAERSFVSLGFDGLNAWFNLATGAVGTVESGLTATITPAGDGWYRCAVYRTVAVAAAKTFAVYIANANNAVSYTGDGTSGIYLWGAQLSDSASLDAYSPVYGAAVTSAAYYAPRLDYDANGSALGLLVEEQRSNLLLHSADFTNAVWDTNVGSVTVTANQATAPDGTLSADLIEDNTGNPNTPWILQTFSGSAGTTYTFSVWAKAAGASSIRLWLYDNAGSTGSTLSITLTSSWQRFSITRQITAGATLMRAGFDLVPTGGVHVWGAQLDSVTGGNAPFATSYIPTGAATATRTADVASVSTQAFPYSASEGTLVGEVRGLLSNTITQVPLVNFGDVNNRIELRAVGDPFTYNRAVVVNSGSTVVDINATGLPASASATRKVGLAFKLNDFATTGTGGTVGTTSSGTIPSVSVMNIGTAPYSASLKTNGWIARITYIPRRLSNSELQARTV